MGGIVAIGRSRRGRPVTSGDGVAAFVGPLVRGNETDGVGAGVPGVLCASTAGVVAGVPGLAVSGTEVTSRAGTTVTSGAAGA